MAAWEALFGDDRLYAHLPQAPEDGGMLTVKSVEARMRRLEVLCKGLAKETVIIREANDLLLYLERKEYLSALRDIIAGGESVWIALTKALHRIRDGGGAKAG
jgi:hypothetical protein